MAEIGDGAHSLGKARNRKKLTKLRKSKDEDLRSGLVLPPQPTTSESSRHYAGEETKPPLPPLPTGYKQVNYEETYEKSGLAKHQLNSQPPTYSAANETSLEHQNRLLYQKQLSKSVGDNLQQRSKPKFSTLDTKNRLLRPLSSGDLLGKTDEELILLLIQLKRNQSQLKHTIEKLTLQMTSEDKMSVIEPHKVAEHKRQYEQVKQQLIETQKQYESQFPLIDMIDNMVRFNSSSRSNLNNLNNPIYGYNAGAGHSGGGLTSNTANSLSTNNVYASSTNSKDSGAARNSTSTSYLNRLAGEQTDERSKRVSMNDESDYAESDANNGTYTNRSSTACAQQLSEITQDLTVRDHQSISTRNTLEIPSHQKPHHAKAGQQQANGKTTNSKQASEQTSSQATTTNTLSSVIASVKQMHSNANVQVNQPKQQLNQQINQATSGGKSRTVLAEEEMQRMKEQQMLLEAELERVRTLLLNSQLNVPQSNLDDLSIATTTENHFQAELEHIDNEINNLNAKKEKLIQSLKRKEHGSQHRAGGYCNASRSKDLEDGTDLFTDDDAIFSTANSIDFERILDDGLSLCTDVDDLELSKHENEYVQTLQAEHEQNLKQQEEERRKLERQQNQMTNERKRQEPEQSTSSSNNNEEEDEGTTETTIYKTLRLVKRKYESSKLNKQLTFDSGDILSIDNKVIEVKRTGNLSDKTETESKLKVRIFCIKCYVTFPDGRSCQVSDICLDRQMVLMTNFLTFCLFTVPD